MRLETLPVKDPKERFKLEIEQMNDIEKTRFTYVPMKHNTK